MGGRTSKAAAAPTAAAGAASAADAHMTPASIKKLFEEIDEDKSGTLELKELGSLLKECFPSRATDTEQLLAEFKIVGTFECSPSDPGLAD